MSSMMTMSRDFFIPKGALKVSDKASDAVAYLYQTKQGAPALRVFWGKQNKPVFNAYFIPLKDKSAEAQRVARVAEYFASRQAAMARKANYKAKRKALGRGVEVGNVLVSSWGYDQTNINYYQVVALVGETMVEYRPIGQVQMEATGYMAGRCMPNIDGFTGEAKRAVAKDGRVKINGSQSATVWDGKPDSWTAYA